MGFPVTGLVVKEDRLDRRILDPATKEVLGEVQFPTSGEHAAATVIARGERYDAFLQDLRLKKGDEELMSAVEAKGVWCRLTIDYMGGTYVADYTPKGWFVRLGAMKVGQFNYNRLRYAESVPLLVQLYLLWYALEKQPDIDSRMRAAKLARCCGMYMFA